MKGGVFPRFVKALRRDWAVRFSGITPMERSHGRALPKTSTFSAGWEPPDGRRLFLNLQHHSKSWHVGCFTVNVVVALTDTPPDPAPQPTEDFWRKRAGWYRLGSLLHGDDKWWALLPTHPLPTRLSWEPRSYQDEDAVFREAIEDVSGDVGRLLLRIERDAAEQGDEADEC